MRHVIFSLNEYVCMYMEGQVLGIAPITGRVSRALDAVRASKPQKYSKQRSWAFGSQR